MNNLQTSKSTESIASLIACFVQGLETMFSASPEKMIKYWTRTPFVGWANMLHGVGEDWAKRKVGLDMLTSQKWRFQFAQMDDDAGFDDNDFDDEERM